MIRSYLNIGCAGRMHKLRHSFRTGGAYGKPSELASSSRLSRIETLRIYEHRGFHTSSQKNAPPLIAVLLKTGGVKVLKGLSIVFGRSFRKLYDRLPESVRTRIGKHKIVVTVGSISFPFIAYYSYTHYEACPITGRRRWITFTRDQVIALADLDLERLLTQYQGKLLSPLHPHYLKNVEIVSALVRGNSDIDYVKDTDWTVYVIDDPTVANAFVLPNGHIFVFTGMLKMLNYWEEMAIILGHEMSHAILGHSQEQQSYLAFGEILTVPLLAFIWFYFEDFAAFLAYTIQHHVYPLIFEYGFSLPYSRSLEAEADEVGLILSSKACFDPRWSVLLWEKMAFQQTMDDDADSDKFEFLSTHPGNQNRSASLEKKLPEAIEIRKQCNCPPLDSKIDPQAAAHHMRLCVANIKKQKELTSQLKEKESLLLEESNVKSDKSKDETTDTTLQQVKEEYDQLKQHLHQLEHEYKLLTESPKTKEQETLKKKQENPFLSIWRKISGNIAVSGKLNDTLCHKENFQLSTVSMEKSALGRTKV